MNNNPKSAARYKWSKWLACVFVWNSWELVQHVLLLVPPCIYLQDHWRVRRGWLVPSKNCLKSTRTMQVHKRICKYDYFAIQTVKLSLSEYHTCFEHTSVAEHWRVQILVPIEVGKCILQEGFTWRYYFNIENRQFLIETVENL